jgi:transmembrane sensor
MSVQRQIDRLIAYQAAEWFEALKSGEEEHREGFVRWISESPRHMEAFLGIASEAPGLRAALRGGGIDVSALLRRVAPGVASLSPDRIATAAAGIAPARRRRRGVIPAAAAAAVALVALSGLLVPALSRWQRFETPVGEQRAIQLVEGSIVNLNAQSRVDVLVDEARRDIRLLRGEATFKVSADRKRPFRVYAPNAVVEALGTQFNVYVRPDGTTTVSVLEGKVRVTGEGVTDVPQAPALVAGQEVQVDARGDVLAPMPADVSDAVAWQQRRLVFKRSALRDIAAEFNRYNKSLRIRLEGAESESFRFTGAFDADDPMSLADLLEREPGLSIERRDGQIVIHAAR